jgi:hypothetical protein
MIDFYREFPDGERGRKKYSEYVSELHTEKVGKMTYPTRLLTDSRTRYSARG